MSTYGYGRHEHGQNFLTDHKIINSIVDLVKQTSGPIIEIGPGSGALTHPISHLGRAITAVEVDAKLAAKLTKKTASASVEVVHDDFLNWSSPVEWCNRFVSFGLGYALSGSGGSSCPVGWGVSRDLVRMSRLR